MLSLKPPNTTKSGLCEGKEERRQLERALKIKEPEGGDCSLTLKDEELQLPQRKMGRDCGQLAHSKKRARR